METFSLFWLLLFPVYLGLCQDDTKHTVSTVQTQKSRRVTTYGADGCPHSPLQLTRHTVLCLCLENTLTNQLGSHKIISKSDKLKNTLQHIKWREYTFYKSMTIHIKVRSSNRNKHAGREDRRNSGRMGRESGKRVLWMTKFENHWYYGIKSWQQHYFMLEISLKLFLFYLHSYSFVYSGKRAWCPV